MKVYAGRRSELGTLFVTIEDHREGGAIESRALPPRFDLFNHSPTGFECGYYGSGPAQLALAILADALSGVEGQSVANIACLRSVDEVAVRLHQDYKADVVARLAAPFDIVEEEVLAWIAAKAREIETRFNKDVEEQA